MHKFTVTEENDKLRLDIYLTDNLPDALSRSFDQKLIGAGHVSVNKVLVKANYKIQTADTVEVDIPAGFLSHENIAPEMIPLDIVYEDGRILVINKPVGMVVHPAGGNYSGTLVNALLHHTQDLSDINTHIRPGIVHRLDQDTSGIIVIAKDNKSHAYLSEQFQSHDIKKRYVALVEGEVQFDEGQIDEPLGRNPIHRDKRKVSYEDDAKEALTIYRVIKRSKDMSYVALYPRTGRTHQLRVHMAHIHHPILGDEKYGKKWNFPRLALHAQSIGFAHPGSRRFIEFSIPPPVEFLERIGL